MKLDTSCEVFFFASSSGHCTFDCQYCIVHPIAKHQPSLDYDDLKFLLDFFQVKAFFAFSGIGDFFASYRRSDRLLSRLLEEDVEVALDTNGSILQDFPDLPEASLRKIRYINLTMHYHQIKRKGQLDRWSQHARIFLDRRYQQTHPDYILSPPLMDEWEEALAFYAREIYAHTGKPLLLVRDIDTPFPAAAEARLRALCQRFGPVVDQVHQEDFAAAFRDRPEVLCPAGRRYFRLWNDGRVQGCPNLPGVPDLFDCGNLKERRIRIRDGAFHCNSPRFCDCNVIDNLGKMDKPARTADLAAV
jgi:MoaA/NifB/PqqE/SkfB family radical SAM enzyme